MISHRDYNKERRVGGARIHGKAIFLLFTSLECVLVCVHVYVSVHVPMCVGVRVHIHACVRMYLCVHVYACAD